MDKAETAIVGAALEIIQRIGPCNAKVRVESVEDVRVSKRQFVIERAKELLKTLTDSVLPNSQEITEEVGSISFESWRLLNSVVIDYRPVQKSLSHLK